ncbi:hypothetical protein CROQUDRAFT_652210 [Cronartium quercuum f. sp. fusiforme G11]|uniref:GS catalytic domain-containing protein n=1 Tax=Cronartium quercuum f. sp. fusiforme G11 TaxID=708437 RepID=A0A9P6TG43_9BASI|nr:hypothetical protein CROQUDRAFT_652210 [Cronartium quercuum f. sp. fusiforme G11]
MANQDIINALSNDSKVKLAGIDADGVLRGKLISKDKFISCLKSEGLGWCSVVFGWDIHDQTYQPELEISNVKNGYRDLTAQIDLSSFRRIPWESNIPFFLVDFIDPDEPQKALCACPRGLLKTVLEKLKKIDCVAFAGIEYEYFQFKETSQSVKDKAFTNLNPLTPGMHGYSLLRPNLNQDYYHDLFDSALAFGISVEGHHTETGPGVYETALAYTDALKMADNASLFKLTAKSIGMKCGIIPSFMAKPHANLPGCSGHVHISLRSLSTGTNAFVGPHPSPAWPEHTAHLSLKAEQFIAGLMACLPDLVPCLIPTVNGYKRLVEGFWAATEVSWGLDSRLASVRLIAPPTCPTEATRLEVRVPGADMNPHYALAAIIAAGLYGIEQELSLKDFAPINSLDSGSSRPLALPKTLEQATKKFMAAESKARVLLGDPFVNHFGRTRVEWTYIWLHLCCCLGFIFQRCYRVVDGRCMDSMLWLMYI